MGRGRWLLLCGKANERSSHQNAMFRKYLEAHTHRDIAREKAAELPNDSARQEALKVAVENSIKRGSSLPKRSEESGVDRSSWKLNLWL